MGWLSKLFSNGETQASAEPQKPLFSAADYCERGQKSLDAGKYVEAMEFFQAAIEADKRFEKAYFLLATAYEKQGNKDKAKAALYGLLAFDPNNEKALNKLNYLMQSGIPHKNKDDSNNIQKQERQNDTQTTHISNAHNDSIKGINIICNVGAETFEMVYVEGGSFYCGAQSKNRYEPNYDPEAPYFEYSRKENVKDFYIGKYLVTQSLWKEIMGDNPASHNHGGDFPIENVTSSEIREFIKRLNKKTGYEFRLPSDVEWEYAARGGKNSKGYKYPGSNDLHAVAWTYNHEVGKKQPNELGLYDMMGNVMELCNRKSYYSLESYYCFILKGGANHRMVDWRAYSLDRRRRLEYITLNKIYSWAATMENQRDTNVGIRLAMDK
jgi:formylglycine-generating enzyme required for sulfatase activity